MGWLWILVTVIGVALLGLAIAYAMRQNKDAPPSQIAEAERGAQQVRDELVEDEARRGD